MSYHYKACQEATSEQIEEFIKTTEGYSEDSEYQSEKSQAQIKERLQHLQSDLELKRHEEKDKRTQMKMLIDRLYKILESY